MVSPHTLHYSASLPSASKNFAVFVRCRPCSHVLGCPCDQPPEQRFPAVEAAAAAAATAAAAAAAAANASANASAAAANASALNASAAADAAVDADLKGADPLAVGLPPRCAFSYAGWLARGGACPAIYVIHAQTLRPLFSQVLVKRKT